MTLLNTDMSRELDNIARFFRMATDYADAIGFDGQLLIEPKSKEPTKYQYDFDVAAVLAFLWKYGLENRFAFNLERNHAALAGHTFQHEIRYTRYETLENGGREPGGLNFDAKVRRDPFELADLFHGHVAGVDTFVKASK